MTIVRQKVTCYVTQGNRLLVFDHTAFPEAGTQVPGGTLEPGEVPAVGALREAREETSLQNLVIRSYLGTKEYDLNPLGKDEINHRHYFHLECLEQTPERWLAYEHNPSDGSPAPIEFEFYWVSFPDQVPALSGWLDDFIDSDALTLSMASAKNTQEQQMLPLALSNIVTRNPNPAPWSEGDNIPWHDPAFSERMLKEHLSQDHDAASRRFSKIDTHIVWIHNHIMEKKLGRVLDLGCGPGFYACRLARLGHTITGIDYSPASIAYARAAAAAEQLPCQFIESDLRTAHFGPASADSSQDYDFAMLIYGETNIFRPADIRSILQKAFAALKPGGVLLLEPHTFEIVKEIGQRAPSWFTAESSVFAAHPHLVLTENLWDPEECTANVRHYVIDTDTSNVIRYAQTFQAYQDDEYQKLLSGLGFENITFFPSLLGIPDPEQEGLIAITARKSA